MISQDHGSVSSHWGPEKGPTTNFQGNEDIFPELGFKRMSRNLTRKGSRDSIQKKNKARNAKFVKIPISPDFPPIFVGCLLEGVCSKFMFYFD